MKLLVFNDRDERIKNLETYKQDRRAYAGNLDHLELATKDDHIKKYYRLLYKDNSGVWREYIVTDIEEVHDIDGTSFYIYAENSLIETKWAFIEDKRSYDQYPQNAINIALSETRWTGVTTVTENRNVNFYRISAFEAIESIMETWDLEILTEINVSKTKILSRKLYFQPRVGRSLDKRFSWTKDMTEISRRVNDDEIITALYGFGKSLPTEGGGFGRKIDFSEINNGLMYVANEEAKNAYGYLGKNGLSHRFGQVNINTDDKEELLRLTQDKLEEVSQPKITYKASVIDLASYGYDFEEVEAGDFVGIRDKELDIAIKARITELTEDLDGIEAKKLVIGNFVDTIATSMTKLQSTVDVLDQQTQEQINQVANIVKQTADGQNHIFFGPDEPTAFKNNDIWFKLLPSGIEVLNRWNGSAWVEIIDPQKMDTAVQAIQDIEQKAQEAFTKAEEATNEAIKAIAGLEETNSTIAQLTDGDVTAYNQKISTALGDIQTIKDADYATQISNVAGRINVQIVDNSDGSKSMMDMTSNQLLYNINGGKIQVTKDKFYMDQTLIVPIIQTTKLSATQIESGTLDANKANIINLNAANIVGENANLVRGSFNAINSSINIDGTALTTKGNWGGDIKLSNRGLTVFDNLANREMGVLYGLFRNDDDPLKAQSMLATGLFANYGYKLNIGLRNQTNNVNYSVISLDTADTGKHQMNVFGDILARYDLKMFGGMLTGAANAGYTVTEANGGHCIELANGWKIQFWRSSYQTFSSGWTEWTFPKRFTSIPRVVLAQAMRDDENFTPCNAYSLNYQACNIRIQDKTLQWTIVAMAIGR